METETDRTKMTEDEKASCSIYHEALSVHYFYKCISMQIGQCSQWQHRDCSMIERSHVQFP